MLIDTHQLVNLWGVGALRLSFTMSVFCAIMNLDNSITRFLHFGFNYFPKYQVITHRYGRRSTPASISQFLTVLTGMLNASLERLRLERLETFSGLDPATVVSVPRPVRFGLQPKCAYNTLINQGIII